MAIKLNFLIILLTSFYSLKACPVYLHINDTAGSPVEAVTVLVDNKAQGLTNHLGELAVSLEAGIYTIEIVKKNIRVKQTMFYVMRTIILNLF